MEDNVNPTELTGTDEALVSNTKKRKAQREQEEAELRLKLDPEGKLNKRQLRNAMSSYHMSLLSDEQLIAKLSNVNHSTQAVRFLTERGIDLSKYTIAKREVVETEAKVHEIALQDTDYYFLNGHRLVWPYPFIHSANAKKRWWGRTLENVLAEEFLTFHEGYLDDVLQKGRLTINGHVPSKSYVFRDGDVMLHQVHKHEPAVKAVDIPVIVDRPDLNLLVVSKPSSMPVHPCGKFLMNSVTSILGAKLGRKNQHVVHRQDRPTSGLLIFAMDSASAEKIGAELRERSLKKHYLARVKGKFPSSMEEALVKKRRAEQLGQSADIAPQLGSWEGAEDAVVLWDGVGVRSLENASRNMKMDETDAARESTVLQTEYPNTTAIEIVVDRPVSTTNLRYAMYGVGPAEEGAKGKYNELAYGTDGKAALTCFRFQSYDSETDTSLVHCLPRTGRTHQIRVHLMHTGHPIANDERYGGAFLSPWRGEEQEYLNSADDCPKRREQLWKNAVDPQCVFCQDINAGVWDDRYHFLRPARDDDDPALLDTSCQTAMIVNDDPTSSTTFFDGTRGYVPVSFKDQHCNSGNRKNHTLWDGTTPVDEAGQIHMGIYPENADIDPQREVIWLHALKYEGPHWTFQVPVPQWADNDNLVIPNMYYERK